MTDELPLRSDSLTDVTAVTNFPPRPQHYKRAGADIRLAAAGRICSVIYRGTRQSLYHDTLSFLLFPGSS